ncbi:monosaccharide ABC transporter membrane protein (CUT2 family) [Rhizobium sp. PP-F2F-G38]|uniref:ABC transporter permease n=1 Tax=Ferranicluibacter rubi TaxID=2715133 RepID=A0AA43ZDC0_9HYPH|nr:ABC transporter permease [Ferranicluibacter rubi]PYE32590.1 monosaccharide ABC transporter membrane protein (CUT2 family) [Rhizobium sp. PP-WC-1G-195]PYE96019.1 monosaccharide ABC transporter membrane protein (CUT2 family) [Rhizobium sp. PP-F2F-G38]TCP88376.1 monosaccharide ABC transporter membrane protein (CUT2 family) [Rhizobium sp. PP-CC-2G-626]TCQ22959.1 monosaccharide ABC transporter membrane protein (CUT2 family) [Rhizobium sp. PP-CC-3G-465]NHT75732.1 ABC transporter permease [Ferrani
MVALDINGQARPSGTWRKKLSGATGPLVGLLALCIFLGFSTDAFFSLRNGLNILDQITVIGIMAVGMTFVILIGGIDLSVGSVLALSMMVMGWTANIAGLPLSLAIAVALVASAVSGLIVGLLVTVFRVPAFIATLAMMSAARGVANMITDGQQIVGFPEWFMMLAIDRHFGVLTATVFLMLFVVLIAWLFLHYRAEGRMLYAVGGNPEVARLAGINVQLVTIGVYVVSAVLAGLAGIVLAARLDSVQPSSGFGYELDTIAAVVIGGTSLSGGAGGIGGTLIGVLIIGVLRNGLNLLNVSPFLQQVIIGVVIVLAVGAETMRRRRA